MNGSVEIRVSRAAALIPCMLDTIGKSHNPLILVPESFTLATEQAIIGAAERKGFIGTQIFSPTSLVREIRELAGFRDKTMITGDGRNMILSLLLLKNRGRLLFYGENINQRDMAEKLASQIDDLADSGFDCGKLGKASEAQKHSTKLKCMDIALIWSEYLKILDSGYADQHDSWKMAMERLESSGLFHVVDLIIFGFDRINMNLTDLITTAYPLVNSITVGLVSGTGGGDDHIFAYTSESLKRFLKRMRRLYPGIPVSVDKYDGDESGTDPGIRFIERNVFALGKSCKDIPDLSSVSVYYASDTYIECLYTAQTLIGWHRDGIAWHDMAVAICGDSPVASLLPLVLSSAKIPYTDRTGISMLLSEYAQFFIATLRSIRSGFKQEEMLKLIKSEFAPLNGDEMMDMENYVRQYGIDRSRWQKQFDAEDDRTELLEEARLRLIEPLAALRKRLSAKSCTGRAAAEAIYEYMVAAGAYDKLLTRERELIDADMLNAADRNRQVWTAVNEMLDQLTLFARDDHLSAEELCLMLESSISARMIKSLPQIAESVTVSSPNMFFSSGVRAAAVIGMQERSSTPSAALLTPSECTLLLRSAGEDDITASIGVTKREAAAKAKQEINRAIASATERIMFSCSARQPNGKALIPSAEFREISELVSSQHPENVRGGLSNDDLGPFTPQFAMERLASMLRSAEKEEDSFLTSDDPVSFCWRESLAFLYGNGSWHDKTSAVLDSLHVTVSKGGIPSDLATLLYGRDRLSVSAVETAGICPFRAFMEYALRVKERKDFVFETDSEGTFSHEVLRYFFERASALPVYPALSDSDISSLLDSVIEEQTKPWYNGPLGRNVSGRFRWKGIVDYVRFTVSSLARAIRTTPHFTPIGMEVGFGRSHTESHPHFPAVELDLGDGRKAELNGSIDRVDTVILDDGRKAALLYDFKSSVKEVRGEALRAGLQLQLPIYMIAAQNGMPDHMIAGALYQPVREIIVESDADDTDIIDKRIESDLCSRGIILDDERIRTAASPVKYKVNSSSSDIIRTVSEEGMTDVIKRGADSACAVIRKMLDGETAPDPLQDGVSSPCGYCGARNACPFDTRIDGCRVRKLKNLNDVEE